MDFVALIYKQNVYKSSRVSNFVQLLKNKYGFLDCFFYYNKQMVLFSTFETDFFDLSINWQSFNMDIMSLYFIRYKIADSQLTYASPYYPGGVYFNALNNYTREFVYTNNATYVRTNRNTSEKIFAINGKPISFIDESIPSNPYVQKTPARLAYFTSPGIIVQKEFYDNKPLSSLSGTWYITRFFTDYFNSIIFKRVENTTNTIEITIRPYPNASYQFNQDREVAFQIDNTTTEQKFELANDLYFDETEYFCLMTIPDMSQIDSIFLANTPIIGNKSCSFAINNNNQSANIITLKDCILDKGLNLATGQIINRPGSMIYLLKSPDFNVANRTVFRDYRVQYKSFLPTIVAYYGLDNTFINAEFWPADDKIVTVGPLNILFWDNIPQGDFFMDVPTGSLTNYIFLKQDDSRFLTSPKFTNYLNDDYKSDLFNSLPQNKFKVSNGLEFVNFSTMAILRLANYKLIYYNQNAQCEILPTIPQKNIDRIVNAGGVFVTSGNFRGYHCVQDDPMVEGIRMLKINYKSYYMMRNFPDTILKLTLTTNDFVLNGQNYLSKIIQIDDIKFNQYQASAIFVLPRVRNNVSLGDLIVTTSINRPLRNVLIPQFIEQQGNFNLIYGEIKSIKSFQIIIRNTKGVTIREINEPINFYIFLK